MERRRNIDSRENKGAARPPIGRHSIWFYRWVDNGRLCGHRGWISRIAVLESRRRQGIGESLIQEAEKRLAALGCIKVNLQVVASNATVLGFYRSLGYQVEERVSMSKRLT
jgi:ribosomal protein S18 acetylase RimI-like enzyme